MSPILSLVTLALAAQTPGDSPVLAQIDNGGGLRLVRDGSLLGTVAFSVALKGWSFHSPEGEGKSPVRIKTPQGQVDVSFTIEPRQDGIRYTVEATPQADLEIESAHVGFKSPIGLWTEGRNLLDGKPLDLPRVSTGLDVHSGPAKQLRLQKGNRLLTLAGESDSGFFRIEDRRQWEPYIEVRIGVDGGTWAKGQTRKYALDLVTGSPVEVRALEPYIVKPGVEWAPLESPLDVEPDSALDWSPANVQPAGAQGWLRVSSAGLFEFSNRPGERAKFYGANLCFSATHPDKQTADRVARRLRMLGYNTVRLHHYDSELTYRWDGKGPDSTVLDPAALDRFDYFFSKLKENGIYVKIDLFTIRQIRENEVLPGKLGTDEYKALLLFHKGAQQNWLKFARNLLTHRNPYTKLEYRNDPALAWICTVNENNFGSATRDMKPASKALLQKEYEKWGGKGEWTYSSEEGARFGGHLHATSYRWMRDELRRLGVKALLTDNNGWHDSTSLIENRNQLDFVDNHYYWAHPSFLGTNWGLPSRHTNESMVPSLPGALAGLSATRIFGKPFTVSELNSSAPNQYRGESGLIFGALAAIQDWDAVWRFAYSHSEEAMAKQVGLDYFNVATDPANLAGERAMIALLLKGHLPPAPTRAVQAYAGAELGAAATSSYTPEIYQFQVGSLIGNASGLTSPVLPHRAVMIDQERAIFALESGMTQGAAVPPGETATTQNLTIAAKGCQANLWVSSLDGKSLNTSERMLLTHVTDVQNDGARFRTPDRDVIEAWGGPAKVMRRGSAQVTLAHAQPSAIRVYRLSMSGKRLGTVPVEVSAGNVSFEVSTDDPRGATMYYEIIRE